MTKSEAREVQKAAIACHMGMRDMAARSVSALIRAARTNRSRDALLRVARDLGLQAEPDFII